MAASEDELRKGMAQQQAGDWKGALEHYRAAISNDPANSQALFRAGMAQVQLRRLDLSADLLRRSVTADPGFADAVKALGGVLLSQRNYGEAAEVLERACALSPDSATVHCDLGAAYVALQDLERAAASYTKAIVLKPDFAEAHNKLGNIQRHQGDLERAVLSYKRAARAEPGHAQAWYNLAVTLQVQEEFPKALEAYQRALALEPNNPGAENNMGLVLKAGGRIPEAIAAFRRAIALTPDYVLALTNLGTTLQAENKLEESIEVLLKAIGLAPGDHRAFSNIGNAYVALNRTGDGIAAYRKALELEPGLDEARYNIALARLLTGDLEGGWADYDARLGTKAHKEKYPVGKPRWHLDQKVTGKTVLVYAEQGLGDTLQFVRYIPLLVATGARVVVRVQVALKAFLEHQLGAATVISTKDPLPDHDLQCALLSLPGEFGTWLDSVPSKVPYLAAPDSKLAAWRNVFSKAPGLKVGLVWSGNPRHQFDRNRSMPLETVAEMTRGMPAHFFAIQKDFRGTDFEKLAGIPHIHDLSAKVQGFEDTAAIVSALDLVITVDTSVAHLAGALGAKAWVLLAYAPDWRWLLERDDSPWYPSLRLFRQDEIGDWACVVNSVREALTELAASGPPP